MKNKFINKLIVVFLALITLFIFSSNTYALEETLTIGSVEDLGQRNAGGFPEIGVHKRMTNDGKYVYCLDSNKSNLFVGYKMTLDKEIDDAGIIYIAMNGFPSKKMTGDTNKDYYITQFVIWLYNQNIHGVRYSVLDPFTRGEYDNYEITPHIKKLYNGAVEAYKKGIVAPSLSVSSNSDLVLSSNGKYLESTYNAVNINGASKYDVNIKNNTVGAYTVDSNGSKKSTFNSNEKFKVLIPIENIKDNQVNIEVEINAKAVINKVYRYKHSNPDRQRIMNMNFVSTTKDLNKAIKFNYEIKLIDVTFSKQDITSKEELPGATLVVKNASGNVIEKWISTDKAHIIKLTPGKYTLTETIAPEGYILSTETINFEVKEDGSVTKVVMYNKLKDLTVIKISKQDITNKKELPGATLVVKDASGKVIDSWVSTNEPHLMEKLPAGKYTLTETIAPEGYILSTETIEFEVKNDGSIKNVVMYNAPKDLTVVKISKQDITNKEELPGATLEVRDSEGKVIDSWVSTNEPHLMEKLPLGKYTLEETIAPEGFELSKETIEFEVKNDGTIQTVVMYNAPSVEVPRTDLNASSVVILCGIILSLFGVGVVYKYAIKE